VDRSHIPRYYYISTVDMVIAVENQKQQKALAALVIALIATRKVAIARFVGREKTAPKLIMLLPHKSKNS